VSKEQADKQGAATAVVAVAAFFVLPDYPSTTKWLNEEEKALAVSRVSSGLHAGEEAEMSHRTAFVAAIKDPRMWGFLLTYNVRNTIPPRHELMVR
jgi:hypothetical protein